MTVEMRRYYIYPILDCNVVGGKPGRTPRRFSQVSFYIIYGDSFPLFYKLSFAFMLKVHAAVRITLDFHNIDSLMAAHHNTSVDARKGFDLPGLVIGQERIDSERRIHGDFSRPDTFTKMPAFRQFSE